MAGEVVEIGLLGGLEGHCVRIGSHDGGLGGWVWLADLFRVALCEDWLAQGRFGWLERTSWAAHTVVM